MALLQNAISEDYRDKETFNLGLVFKVKRLRVNLQSAKTEAQSRKLDHIDDKSNKDAWSAQPWQASKFAHWFLEEEKKPIDDISSSKNRDLLSLIVSSDKVGSHVSTVFDEKAIGNMPRFFPSENTEVALRVCNILSCNLYQSWKYRNILTQ